MISKELLSDVLKEKAYDIEMKSQDNISFWTDYDQYEEMNIHELAHKCKEWAMMTHGIHGEPYIIESSYEHFTINGDMYAIVRVYHDGDMVWNNYSSEFIGEWHTEPEAIFKACEWILEQATK